MGPTRPTFDTDMMRRAIALAMCGRGAVEPNPMVGCVIAKGDRIIGQGWHRKFGQAHAEPDALSRCTESPAGATACVTLEPCCHTNKKTPPCVPALIAAKLARVVIGCTDPNPQVNGRGVAQLQAAGIDVKVGVLDIDCRQLIAPFIARAVLHRPYVTLKWAQTADGKIAGPGSQRNQISNEDSMRVVHELRARCDAILVGINTVLNDDPMLTARHVENARPLLRYVLDRRLRIPLHSRLVQTARDVPLVVGLGTDGLAQAQRLADLEALGVRFCPAPFLHRLMPDAYTRGVTHLLVEPGPTLARSFIDDNLADRIWVFRSPKVVGESSAPSAITVPYPHAASVDLSGDTLTEYLNPRSPAFFANVPSADMARVIESRVPARPQ